MSKFTLRQSLLLLLTATIWGVAFVAQSVGMDYVQPFTFNATRNIIGGIVLLPCIAWLNRHRDGGEPASAPTGSRKTLFLGGICCGICLFIASSLQQIGIQYTTVGKAGFITAMYIVIVPLLGIFVGKKTGLRVWLGVVIAIVGLYLLCMTGDSLMLGRGDILVLLCAVAFSFHILTIDHFAPLADGVQMSCIQFFTCGILSAIGMFLVETPQLSLILAAWAPILYAGVLSCGVAYTVQIIGQRGMNPTVASLILSLESVISVISGWLILHQTLSAVELAGCAVMFVAIILVQLPEKKKVR